MRPVSAAEAQVPLGVRVRLGHAAAQHVADAVGARILHLKGYALAESLRWPGRVGTDVDVLVHPGDLKTYLAGLAAAGSPATSIGIIMYCAAPAKTMTLDSTASHHSAPAWTKRKPNTVPSGM